MKYGGDKIRVSSKGKAIPHTYIHTYKNAFTYTYIQVYHICSHKPLDYAGKNFLFVYKVNFLLIRVCGHLKVNDYVSTSFVYPQKHNNNNF